MTELIQDAAIVSAIVILLQAAKLVPAFKAREHWFSLVAIALGIIAVVAKAASTGITVDTFIIGVITGGAASVAYDKTVGAITSKPSPTSSPR